MNKKQETYLAVVAAIIVLSFVAYTGIRYTM